MNYGVPACPPEPPTAASKPSNPLAFRSNHHRGGENCLVAFGGYQPFHPVAQTIPVFRLKGHVAASLALLPHQSQESTVDDDDVTGAGADVLRGASWRNG